MGQVAIMARYSESFRTRMFLVERRKNSNKGKEGWEGMQLNACHMLIYYSPSLAFSLVITMVITIFKSASFQSNLVGMKFIIITRAQFCTRFRSALYWVWPQ